MTIDEFHRLIDKTNRNSMSEHDIQVECVNWFRRTYPEFCNLFWSTPNGGYRSSRTAKEMKAEGQLAGVPDLQLALPNAEYHGLFLEMKRSRIWKKGQMIGKGRTSDRQDSVIESLRCAGYKVEVCYSVEQFKEIIDGYINER